MIYALAKRDTTDAERLAIAQAIQDRDPNVIQQHVANGTIIHIMNAPAHDLACIFCRLPVFATDARPPHGLQAQSTWHFEHRRSGHAPGECVGHVRRAPTPEALGIENPSHHGCYIRLGCETDANGNQTEWHRRNCKTIVDGHTYCHLAQQHQCD